MSKEVCIHGVDLDIACNECSSPFVNVGCDITPKTNKARNHSQGENKTITCQKPKFPFVETLSHGASGIHPPYQESYLRRKSEE